MRTFERIKGRRRAAAGIERASLGIGFLSFLSLLSLLLSCFSAVNCLYCLCNLREIVNTTYVYLLVLTCTYFDVFVLFFIYQYCLFIITTTATTTVYLLVLLLFSVLLLLFSLLYIVHCDVVTIYIPRRASRVGGRR